MTAIRVIKKYPNRRLYDTTRGRYITLDDVKQLVLGHVTLQVVDAKTHKDLTSATLLQIIALEEESMTPIFTIGVLEHFIRFYHTKSAFVLSEFLDQTFKAFHEQQSLFKQPWTAYQQFMQQILNQDKQQPAKKAKQAKKASRS